MSADSPALSPNQSQVHPIEGSQDTREFLRDLDKKLWSAADRLRANLDAAVYKHAVLGLIFLKYVSDSFAMRQREIEAQLRDPASDYFLDPADYGGEGSAEYAEAIRAELVERDYYLEKNVFWVPALARWKTLQDSAKLPPGTEIEMFPDRVGILPAATGVPPAAPKTYKITSTGRLIDDALEAIERENPKLKGVLNKTYTQLQLDPANRVIRFYDRDEPRLGATEVRNRDDLTRYLEQLAELEWHGYVPYDGGEPVFEPNVEGMVENVIERYDERIETLFSPPVEDDDEQM